MKKNFSILIFGAVIFFIIKLILSSHQLQGKLLGLVALVLVFVVLAGIINLISRIFRGSK